MLKFLKPKTRSILGIDISSTSIKILEITNTDGKYCVQGFGSASLPENSIEGGLIKDIDVVATNIRKLLSVHHLTSKQAAIAVPDSSAISKVVQINEGLKEDEIEELVAMEADKYIPYPIDEINLDFNVLGTAAKNSAMLDVLIVASRSEIVNNRVEVISRAGLEAKIVDVESFAVERAAELLLSQLPAGGVNKILAIIDIGAVNTHVFILHGMKIIFTREEEFGGRQLLEAIAEHYHMKPQEAERALEEEKLPDDYVTEVLQPFQERILLQIKRSLQFFFSTTHHTFVDYLMLAGGIAKQANLTQLVQEHINIPTSIANPFLNMELAKKINRDVINKEAPVLLVACGLALRTS